MKESKLISKYFDNKEFDYLIASHYHQDHILGFAQAGIKFKNVVDIGGYGNFTPVNTPVVNGKKSKKGGMKKKYGKKGGKYKSSRGLTGRRGAKK